MFLLFFKNGNFLQASGIEPNEEKANKLISQSRNLEKIYLPSNEAEQIAKIVGKPPKEDLIQMISILESKIQSTEFLAYRSHAMGYSTGHNEAIRMTINLIKTYQ